MVGWLLLLLSTALLSPSSAASGSDLTEEVDVALPHTAPRTRSRSDDVMQPLAAAEPASNTTDSSTASHCTAAAAAAACFECRLKHAHTDTRGCSGCSGCSGWLVG